MTATVPASADLDDLRFRYNGQLLVPGEPGFEEQRQHFNRRFDKHPALIARPVNTVDVVATVKYARAADLEIAISSGGTHMAGFSRTDGGIVIDLSLMRAVKVDPVEQTAWAQAGANGGDLQAEAGRHGLAGVIGWMRGTGIGGVNLNGGWGPLSVKLGWGSDTILELEIVTADGEVLHVSSDENPDLFWAVRGAGSNFGVVTWIKQRLCPVPDECLTGSLIYSAEQGADVLRVVDQLAMNGSGDLSVWAEYTVIPTDPDYPEQLHGKNAVMVTLVHFGAADAADEEVRPLRELSPAMDALVPQPLYDFMCSMDAFIASNRQWYDCLDVAALTDEVIDAAAAHGELLASGHLEGEVILVPHGRGRNPDVPNALPVGQRGGWLVNPIVLWEDAADDERNIAWSDSCMAALRETGSVVDAAYGNIHSRQDAERDRRSYGEADWKRLTELKAKYDPDNVFHLNHNIPPA